MSESPPVQIQILNWNRWQESLETARSMLRSDYPVRRLVLLDNGSTDGSPRKLLEGLRTLGPVTLMTRRQAEQGPSPPEGSIALVDNAADLGYAAGQNVATRMALRDGFPYVLTSPDDTIFAPNALRALVAHAERHPRLALVGAMIRTDPRDGSPVCGGGIVNPREGRCHLKRDLQRLDYICGCCLIRTQALREAGLFNEAFFMYWEDAEISVRLRRRGWGIGVAADAVLEMKHFWKPGGPSAVELAWTTENALRFVSRYHPGEWPGLVLKDVLRIAKSLLTARPRDARAIALAFLRHALDGRR